MDPYVYVDDNPETMIDLTGHSGITTSPPDTFNPFDPSTWGPSGEPIDPGEVEEGIVVCAFFCGAVIVLWLLSIPSDSAYPAATPSDPFVGNSDSPEATPYYPSDPFVGNSDRPTPNPSPSPTPNPSPSPTPNPSPSPSPSSSGAMKPPKPPRGQVPSQFMGPKGPNFQKFGQWIGWGGGGGMANGSAFSDAIARTFEITPAQVETWVQEGLTLEIVEGWIARYEWEWAYNENLTALGRLELMQSIYAEMTGGNFWWRP